MAARFSEMLKRLRIAQGLTLREFCHKHGFDPGNYSKLERGLFPPPESSESIERYATALGIVPGSDEWLQFFDLASAERGRIPADIMSDEQLVQKLPLLFRTIRGKPVSPEQLNELAERVRRS